MVSGVSFLFPLVTRECFPTNRATEFMEEVLRRANLHFLYMRDLFSRYTCALAPTEDYITASSAFDSALLHYLQDIKVCHVKVYILTQ